MPVNLDITSITGTSPYNVFICDTGYTTCVYINTITTGDLTYSFEVPPIFNNIPTQVLKIVDSDGCIILNQYTV